MEQPPQAEISQSSKPRTGNSFGNVPPPNFSHQSKRHSPLFWLVIFIIFILTGALLWHYINVLRAANKHIVIKPIPVITALAHSSNVPVFIPALGQVTPTYSVTVRTQVNGHLLRVNFKEGQMVKAGDLIAQIDPRPFLAQLVQFQGQLERDQAQLHNANLDLIRYRMLYPVGAVSKQTYDTQVWLVKQLEGTVKLDQGQLDTVRVNLVYCYITSPINGRIGLRLVDPGNFVQTSDTNGLVVIDTIQPITVVFSIPEDNVSDVMEKINAGKVLPVEAYDRQQNKLLETGTLLTVDNQIDPTTGTVKLKALFTNNEDILFPNQFVNIQLLVDTLQNVTVIPTAAIQHGPDGTFVFLLNSNNTVSVKPVTVGINFEGNTVINSGITVGQAVVIDGIDKLTDGAKVTLNSSNTTPTLPTPRYSYPSGTAS